MTTVLINDKSVDGLKLLDFIKCNSHVAQVFNEFDNTLFNEELISLEEFKTHMETLAYERLGFKIDIVNNFLCPIASN